MFKWKAYETLTERDLAEVEERVRDDKRRGKDILNDVRLYDGSLLHFAASSGHEQLIRWIFSDEGGRALGFTNVLGRFEDGVTALHLAAIEDHFECCKAIVEGCKVENGEQEEMVNAVSDEGYTVLYLAVVNRNEAMIRWLLSSEEGGGRSFGFNSIAVTTTDWDSQSALHHAAKSGEPTCVEALLSGCTAGERIKLFLAVDKRGWTALHQAARWRKVQAIRELLRWEEAKMIVDTRDYKGMTALHRMACHGGMNVESYREWTEFFYYPSPDEDVVKLLIGLDPTTEATAVAAFADVNAGLKIPEEIKAAVAAAKEEAKK